MTIFLFRGLTPQNMQEVGVIFCYVRNGKLGLVYRDMLEGKGGENDRP
jgi:hypothetical protein